MLARGAVEWSFASVLPTVEGVSFVQHIKLLISECPASSEVESSKDSLVLVCKSLWYQADMCKKTPRKTDPTVM